MKLWQDETVVTALKGILEDYPYLEYDEDETKLPFKDASADPRIIDPRADRLKIKIKDSKKKSEKVGYEIACKLSKVTGRNFMCPNSLTKGKYLNIIERVKTQESRDSEVAPTQKGSQHRSPK